MDPQLYKNEIDRLSNEINSFRETPDKKTFSILYYKYYFLIAILSGALIYLVKPKCILYIHKQNNDKEDEDEDDADDGDHLEIKVSTKYFLLCWVCVALISCISYYIFLLYKSKSK